MSEYFDAQGDDVQEGSATQPVLGDILEQAGIEATAQATVHGFDPVVDPGSGKK